MRSSPQRFRVRQRRGLWQVVDWPNDEVVVAEHLVRYSARAHAAELNDLHTQASDSTDRSVPKPAARAARSSSCT